MSSMLVRVSWQSRPYGWVLRWFGEQGHYTAELGSYAPPYRHIFSGSLTVDDAVTAWRYVQATLASVATEPADPHVNPHIGFVVPVVTENDQLQQPVPYYYYAQPDKRQSTRQYVNLVLVLDPYIRSHYSTLINQDQWWE
jgi:hypothetical protein